MNQDVLKDLRTCQVFYIVMVSFKYTLPFSRKEIVMNPQENKQTKEFVTWSEDSSISIRYVPCQADQLRSAIQLALKSAYVEQMERKEG